MDNTIPNHLNRQLERRPNSLVKNYKDLHAKMADDSKKKASWRNETTARRKVSDQRQKETESPNPNKHGPPVKGSYHFVRFQNFHTSHNFHLRYKGFV